MDIFAIQVLIFCLLIKEIMTCLHFIPNISPFLWGEKAVHFYMSHEGKNWLLWEQPTEQEVMSLLNEKKMSHSIRSFPYNRELQVRNKYNHKKESYRQN